MISTGSYSPIGLTLPIASGNNGYFQQSFDTSEQVKTNLTNFLKTKKGERRMMPDFGTKLYELVFEQKTENLNQIAKSVLIDEISTWVPEVEILNISISDPENSINDDSYKLNISIKFVIKKTQQTDTISFELTSVSI